jgi:uncharacterized delta-60 repeat protein
MAGTSVPGAAAGGFRRAWPAQAGFYGFGSGIGTADPDPDVFGVDGKVGVHGSDITDDFLVGLALAPGGKILASGFAVHNGLEGQPEVVAVTRRNEDGSPDLTFGDKGVVLVKELTGGEATHLLPTADGGVVGSGFQVVDGLPTALVFRLDSRGRLVPGFGQGGIVRFPAGAFSLATRLAVQPDGKIVVTGFSSQDFGNIDISVHRILADGELDHAFGAAGEKIVDLSEDDEATSVVVQPDGKLVLSGTTARNNDAVAVRLQRDGSLDRLFGTGGIATLSARGIDNGSGLALQPDGKVDIVGDTRPTADDPKDAVIFQLLPNGRPDASFNGAGQVVLPNPGDDNGFGIGFGPGQSIVISSFQSQQPGTVTDSFLNRVTATGKPDPAFGTGGTVTVHNPEATFELGLAVQPDGKIVTAGRRGGFNVVDSVGTIDRFTTDGAFDTTR